MNGASTLGTTEIKVIEIFKGQFDRIKCNIFSIVCGYIILSKKNISISYLATDNFFILDLSYSLKIRLPFSLMFRKISPSERYGVCAFYSFINSAQMSSSERYSMQISSFFLSYLSSCQNVVFPKPGNPKNKGIKRFFVWLSEFWIFDFYILGNFYALNFPNL